MVPAMIMTMALGAACFSCAATSPALAALMAIGMVLSTCSFSAFASSSRVSRLDLPNTLSWYTTATLSVPITASCWVMRASSAW